MWLIFPIHLRRLLLGGQLGRMIDRGGTEDRERLSPRTLRYDSGLSRVFACVFVCICVHSDARVRVWVLL